jgi:hypothetical protein
LELQERGELKKLENKWWYDMGQCGKDSGVSGGEIDKTIFNVKKQCF